MVLAFAISIAQLGDYNYGEIIPRIRLGCAPWNTDCGKPRMAIPHLLGSRSRLRTEVASNAKTIYATTTVTVRPPLHPDIITTTVTERSTIHGHTTTVTAQSPTTTEIVTVLNIATTTSTVTAPASITACHCTTTTDLPATCLCTLSGTISVDRASPLPIAFEIEQAMEGIGKEMVAYSNI